MHDLDDFEDLLPTPTRRPRHRAHPDSDPAPDGQSDVPIGVRRGSWRLWTAIAGLGVMVAVGAGGLAVLATPATTPPPQPATTAASTGEVADRDVQAVAWRGATLPVSAADGPHDLTDTHAAGFARTALGAALAAVHLSVRIDPHAGPDTFDPTIRQQVSGNTQQLLASVQRTYTALAQQAGVTDGEPIIAATGAITGWRINDDTSGSRPVVVNLRVDVPGATAVNFAVTVTWDPRTNDWTLESPHGAEAFAMTDAHGTYTNFFPTGS